MSVTIRPYVNGGWEADIRVLLPDGTIVRERRKTPASSKSSAQRWAEARERFLMVHGKPKPVKQEVLDTPTLGEFAPRFLEVEHQHHDVLTDCNDGLQAFRRLVYNQQFITTPECKRMKGISLGVGVLSVLFLASTANAQVASLGKGWILGGSGSITSAPGEVISGR